MGSAIVLCATFVVILIAEVAGRGGSGGYRSDSSKESEGPCTKYCYKDCTKFPQGSPENSECVSANADCYCALLFGFIGGLIVSAVCTPIALCCVVFWLKGKEDKARAKRRDAALAFAARNHLNCPQNVPVAVNMAISPTDISSSNGKKTFNIGGLQQPQMFGNASPPHLDPPTYQQ